MITGRTCRLGSIGAALAIGALLAGCSQADPTPRLVTTRRWHEGFEVAKRGEPRCGPEAPPINGYQPICNPNDPDYHCCSKWGFCGAGADYCACPSCKDYSKMPEIQLVEAESPADVQWHIGFSVAKSGQPRCGPFGPPLNGKPAICNPSSEDPCCSEWGYCGSGPEYCECKNCLDSRKL